MIKQEVINSHADFVDYADFSKVFLIATNSRIIYLLIEYYNGTKLKDFSLLRIFDSLVPYKQLILIILCAIAFSNLKKFRRFWRLRRFLTATNARIFKKNLMYFLCT